jgi:hypothetical protein
VLINKILQRHKTIKHRFPKIDTYNHPLLLSQDFKNFDEESFWRSVESYTNKYPVSTNYEEVFKRYLRDLKNGNSFV